MTLRQDRAKVRGMAKLYVLVIVMKMHEGLRELASTTFVFSSRKVPVTIGLAIIFLAIIALLITRQVLPYNRDIEVTLFALIILIGYGLGSWILLGYTKRVSEEIRAKSRFINLMHSTVTVT
jgi:hypothetical protein